MYKIKCIKCVCVCLYSISLLNVVVCMCLNSWHQMVSCVSLNLLANLFFETLLTEP